jgi:MscS family membrane protein
MYCMTLLSLASWFSCSFQRLLLSVAILALLNAAAPAQEPAESPEVQAAVVQPVINDGVAVGSERTDSPRLTISTFLQLRAQLKGAVAAYKQERDSERAERVSDLLDRLNSLIDLSQVPAAVRRDLGIETTGYLLDIFGRVAPPNLDDLPDASAFADSGPAKYSIPNTPLDIVRVNEGSRQGEFLFSQRTVEVAPGFYRKIGRLPLQSALPIGSWSQFLINSTGPLIPVALVSAIPNSLKKTFLDTPIWKIIATVATMVLAGALLVLWHRAAATRSPKNRIAYLLFRMLSPIAIIVIALVLRDFFDVQVNTAGRFSRIVDFGLTALIYLAWAWIFWLAALAFFEAVVLDPKFPDESLDANMLRLIAQIVGIIGGIMLLAYGAQELGLPVLSLLAGLGIGGLAIALAIRPTLENLIGGFILYLDKPVRVGDFCNFGDHSGYVEKIGVRSTQVRGLDRTLISVPNAQFADMQIVNWARCDLMLIDQKIGLRYETDADQLRYVLAKMREMFHGHPRIDSETVRVRFAGYGASSLDIDIRVYAKTREFNDFYAIKEDVLLRIDDIVQQSGTSFAFPSQTVYLGKDEGLDAELGDKAKQEVAVWRRTSQLPFPRFSASKLEQLDEKLSYPPRGSPDFAATEEELAEGGETLSAKPLQDESSEPERNSDSDGTKGK